jgi:hypothetical protein
VDIYVSDYGEHVPPPELVKAWKATKLRKDGRPDRRYRQFRAYAEIEAAFVTEKRNEWLAGA